MKKQQVYKLSPKDVGNIVMKTLKESNNYRENETNEVKRRTVGRGETDRYDKYRRGTRWDKYNHFMDINIEQYGPMTIYISDDDSIKIACLGNRCFDQTDREISREQAANMLGVDSLDNIDEDGLINEGKRGIDRERAINIIMGHTARKQAYEQLLERDPERAEKFVEFFRQNPAAKYPIWDPEKRIYYNKLAYKTHSGAKATPGPGMNENKRRKPVVKESQKPRRVIKLTESEMVDFIDELTKKVQRSQRRRGL